MNLLLDTSHVAFHGGRPFERRLDDGVQRLDRETAAALVRTVRRHERRGRRHHQRHHRRRPAHLQQGWHDPSNTSRDLRNARGSAEFAWVTSHVFRKTAAAELDRAGLSARQIADQLGHSRPSITQDYYMGRQAVASDAARALDRAYREAVDDDPAEFRAHRGNLDHDSGRAEGR